MDSMRSLNTSLPNSSPPKSNFEPPEQLLQAFKSAALSVTTLYKTAAADQTRARAEGYQDALDDLLAFLDKEHLGLGDGEGWKVRQWATERLDGRDSTFQGNESDDERAQRETRARSDSPVQQRKPSQDASNRVPTRSMSPIRTEPLPPSAIPSVVEHRAPSLSTLSAFTFRSPHSLPLQQDVTMEMSSSSTSPPILHSEPQTFAQITTGSSTPFRVDVTSRPSRTIGRHSSHSGRTNTRSTSSLGSGAGTKRKTIGFGEFFDIGNFGNGKDGFGGGGKRSRFM